MERLGACLLMDSEQTMSGLPYMFTIMKINTNGTSWYKETILIEEVVNDPEVIGWDVMFCKNKKYVWSPGREKIWYALTKSSTPYRYMKYRAFLDYIGSLCTNRGGAKDRTPNPMISWSRDRDLEFMYKLDQYLPGEKFFNKCNPRINPSACSDNVHWRKRIPQVDAQRLIVELCPKFYSNTKLLQTTDNPSTLEQAVRRFRPEYVQSHQSDQDVDDMLDVLLCAMESDGYEIPKMTFMFAKTDPIFSNLKLSSGS